MRRLTWLDINSSYSHSSLALPAIEACREGDEYEWLRVSGTINSDPYQLTKELYATSPTIIAATLWLFNHEIVLAICERIRSLMPEVVIILGGPEFNGSNEPFLRRNSSVDYLFRGEGERVFQSFLRGDDRATIEGLCYLEGDDYIDNGWAKVADFAELPSPESSRFFSYESPFVQLESSRGCFNGCRFCVSGGDKPVRVKPIAEVRERISKIREHGVRDIRLLDRTFNYSPKRASEMLNMFREFEGMNFHLEIHPALLTDELCEVLESMPDGLLHLEAGMQSLDDKVISACGRIGTTEQAMHGLRRLCAMENFETHTDLIAGLPHYTLEQIFRDVRDLSAIGAGEIQLELLKLLPGTKMREDAEQLGIRYAPRPPYEVLETPAATIFELDQARLLSKLLDKFYNSKAWQRVTRLIIEAGQLPTFLSYLTKGELLEKPISLSKRGSLLYTFLRDSMSGSYLDELSRSWIENGLSLRSEEAGDITKAADLPEGVERQPNVHYYIWQGKRSRCLVCYDRSKDHSHPTLIEF